MVHRLFFSPAQLALPIGRDMLAFARRSAITPRLHPSRRVSPLGSPPSCRRQPNRTWQSELPHLVTLPPITCRTDASQIRPVAERLRLLEVITLEVMTLLRFYAVQETTRIGVVIR